MYVAVTEIKPNTICFKYQNNKSYIYTIKKIKGHKKCT